MAARCATTLAATLKPLLATCNKLQTSYSSVPSRHLALAQQRAQTKRANPAKNSQRITMTQDNKRQYKTTVVDVKAQRQQALQAQAEQAQHLAPEYVTSPQSPHQSQLQPPPTPPPLPAQPTPQQTPPQPPPTRPPQPPSQPPIPPHQPLPHHQPHHAPQMAQHQAQLHPRLRLPLAPGALMVQPVMQLPTATIGAALAANELRLPPLPQPVLVIQPARSRHAAASPPRGGGGGLTARRSHELSPEPPAPARANQAHQAQAQGQVQNQQQGQAHHAQQQQQQLQQTPNTTTEERPRKPAPKSSPTTRQSPRS